MSSLGDPLRLPEHLPERRRVDRGRASRTAWSIFSRNGWALFGLAALSALALVAILAPWLAPGDPTMPTGGTPRLSPSFLHVLGTDELGRDVLARLIHGSRISLTVGLLAMLLAVTIGTTLGAVAGYVGGVVDGVIMRLVDIVISFPRLVLVITAVALFRSEDSPVTMIILVLGLTLWPSTARLVRGEVLSLRERDFVTAARALGFSRTRIVFRHLIPNAAGPVIVAATLGVGDTIVLEAGLSYLGLGSGPTRSWGSIVADGQALLPGAWWVATFAGLAIVTTVLCFNLVGEGLRDALSPRRRP